MAASPSSPVPSASEQIRAEIRAAAGALRFDLFMELALYGEHGFYAAGGRAGRRGDFLTSAEVGPLFGRVLARWIDAEWERLDRPDDFLVVECGAGPGTLARAVLAAAPQWRDRYVAVEVSAVQRAEHPAGVRSLAELPGEPFTGVVIANELLDNLPFRLVVFDGGWREVTVADGGDRFVEVTAPVDTAWTFLPATAPHGTRLPIQERAAGWVRAATGHVRQGTVMALDYCVERTADLLAGSWRDWLRTYRGQSRGAHYLAEPGAQDITAQVCIDQLPVATVTSQAQLLQRWGIAELVEEGRQAWDAAAARPDLRAMAMRSRAREAEALLDPHGLGGFAALTWTAGVDTDAAG